MHHSYTVTASRQQAAAKKTLLPFVTLRLPPELKSDGKSTYIFGTCETEELKWFGGR